jgi:hypothetical protein
MSGESLYSMFDLREDGALADLITYNFVQWDNYRQPIITRWKEIEAYRYATDIGDLPDSSAFTHTTHMPIVASIAQDLEAILEQVVMPHTDYFNFEETGLTPVAKNVKLAITKYVKNRTEINGFRDVMKKLMGDLVTYGNCFSMSVYVVNDNGYTGAKPVRISPYDIVFDPTATNFDKTPKIVREVISMGELLSRGQSGQFDMEVVDLLLENRSGFSKKHYTAQKEQQYVPRGFNSYQAYIESGTIEILWFYGDIYDAKNKELLRSKRVAVADQSYLLLDEDIETSSGLEYIFKSGWQDLPDNLWSMSPLENIIGINYQINHRENAKSEGLDRTIYPDRLHAGDVEEMFDDDTGQITYITDEGGTVQDIPINTQFLNFDLHIDRLNFAARQAARLPSDLTGFRSQGEKTLGEVQALTEGGMRGFIDKAGNFERTTLERHLKSVIELAYANFEEASQIKIRTNTGLIETLDLSKEHFESEGILLPMGARRFARKNQLIASLTQLSATPLAQLAGQHISGRKAAEMIEELLEIENLGLMEEFAQLKEQGQAQQMMQSIQQENALQAQVPTMGESVVDQELKNLG